MYKVLFIAAGCMCVADFATKTEAQVAIEQANKTGMITCVPLWQA